MLTNLTNRNAKKHDDYEHRFFKFTLKLSVINKFTRIDSLFFKTSNINRACKISIFGFYSSNDTSTKKFSMVEGRVQAKKKNRRKEKNVQRYS